MRRAFVTVVLAGVLVAAGAGPSMAQMVTRTFDDLRAEAHRGEIVYVTDQGGTKVKGRVERISATSIDLLVNDGSREWAASDVAWITQRRGHAGRGALIGLAFGAGYGVFSSSRTANARTTALRAVDVKTRGTRCFSRPFSAALAPAPVRLSARRSDRSVSCTRRRASVGACVRTPRGAGVIGFRAQLGF